MKFNSSDIYVFVEYRVEVDNCLYVESVVYDIWKYVV